jgi:hypothetical protein
MNKAVVVVLALPLLLSIVFRVPAHGASLREDNGGFVQGAQVPNVIGLGRADAINQINQAGLQVTRILSEPDRRPPGTVIGISPPPNRVIARGAGITLILAAPEPRERSVAAQDFVRIISVSPSPGMVLVGARPARFVLRLEYGLASADNAILSVSATQITDDQGGCGSGSGGALTDAVEVPIQRGARQLSTEVTWSGDTGAGTGGAVYGTGYLGFYMIFWAEQNGQRGEPIRDFGVQASPCFPGIAPNSARPGRLPPPQK